MSLPFRRLASVGAISALMLGNLFLVASAQAASVTPDIIEGNPTCQQLGYEEAMRFEYPGDGPDTYQVGPGTITWAYVDGEISFESTFGIDAVIVKGGPRANVYRYYPPAPVFSDSGLVTPINDGGRRPQLSHLDICYSYYVDPSLDVTSTYSREFTWTIEKTGNTNSVELPVGGSQVVNYDVALDRASRDFDYIVSGSITVANPHPTKAATVESISVTTDSGDAATVTCPSAFPFQVAAGTSPSCTFSTAALASPPTTLLWDVVTSGSVRGASGTTAISWGDPTTLIDECVSFSDTLGMSGTYCEPATVSYEWQIGPFTAEECGEHQLINVASFEAGSGATGSSSHTLDIDVECPTTQGCSLTQGYWKTHSEFGPAPYDETWAMIPGGAAAAFYQSGQSYHDVLGTPPKGGNVYYQLAHQYIGAVLNGLSGADTSAVAAVMQDAHGFFSTYTPTSSLPKDIKKDAQGWASMLDSYNNGEIGPGHCG